MRLPGRWRLATPCRQANGSPRGVKRRASHDTAFARPARTAKLVSNARPKPTPQRNRPVCQTAKAKTTATIRPKSAYCAQSRRRPLSASAERNVSNGETRRISISGSSANSTLTTTPDPSPLASAPQEIEISSANGSRSWSKAGSTSCTTRPRAAPSTAPSSPRPRPCTR